MKTNLVLVFIMVFAIASHGQPPVIPPMEAHWPLDDGKGSVVTEVIGGLNGTLNNADTETAWISGKLGGALRFDGLDDRVIVPHNPAFDFADEDFSVSFLMRWPKGLEPHHEHFLTKGDYASSSPDETGKRWEIIMASGKGVCFNIDDDVNKSQILVPFDAFTTGEWVHVVAVRDTKNNQLRLYADGMLQQASQPDNPYYDGIDRTGSIANPQNLFIGDASRLDNPFQGDLDDVRIFRLALTEQQIVAIASLKEKAPVIPPMSAHFPLDEGQGTVVTEVINGVKGELVNADTTASWISGKLGGALRLDGANDRVFVPHHPGFDFADESFSVSFLMRWPKGNEPYSERFFTKGDYSSAEPGQTGKRWELYISDHKDMTFVIDDDGEHGSSRLKVPLAPYITGEWVHVVAVRDTKHKLLRLYANGVLQESIDPNHPRSNGIDITGSISNPQRLTIGDAFVLDAPFEGALDDIRIFRCALTEQQIAAIASLTVQASPDAEVVVEVENLKLSNAEVRDFESASGKVVAFDVEGAEAKGEVELDRGVYMVYLYMFAPDSEQDAVYVAVGETQERLYPSMHATLTESGSFSINILEKKKYPISITCGETGVLLDRLVIQSIPGQAVTELSEDVPSPAVAIPVQLANIEPGSTDGRPRVIATSDGEIDDECSMVRFLLYANEWDLEAIITSSSQYHWQGHSWAGDDWIEPYLDAYAQVYPNLVKHDAGYPTPEYLRARTLLGNVKAEGEMEEVSAGSQYIVKVLLDEADDQPVWLQAWGGMNTIARALKTIEEEHPEKMAYVANKIHIFGIWEQDSTYQDYIRPHWGKYNIPTIVSDQFLAIAYHWNEIIPEEEHKFFSATWMKEYILEDHGPLCALYKAHEDGRFRSEGDSPSFMHAIVTGLRSMESPDWGGWGGRYVKVRENTWLDPVQESGYKYPEGRWYTSTAWGRERLRKKIHSDKELIAYLKPIWRWSEAFQNDWAARADWCVKSYDEANHQPLVKLAHPCDLKVRPGDTVALSAKGTTDPDGDTLTYNWWQYQEADYYKGTVEIENSGKQDASFTVPGDAGKGETIHIICEVTDTGSPPLTRYQRVVVEIE